MELESREGMGRKRRQGTVLAGITAVVMILGTCILVALSGDFGFEEEVKLLPATFRSGPRAGEPWGEESAGSRKLLMISTSLMVAGLGDGLFSLIVLYMILLLTCCIGCRIDNGFIVYIPLFLVIVLITLILVLAPKVPREQLQLEREADALAVVDKNYIPQTTIIVAVFVGAILSVVLLFICHCIQPVYVRSLDD